MNDFGVIEGTDHLKNTIDSADVGQECISKSCTC
jgi:hypothetical protein